MALIEASSNQRPKNWRSIFSSPPKRPLGRPAHQAATLKRSIRIEKTNLRILKGLLADAEVEILVLPMDTDLTINNDAAFKTLHATEGESLTAFQNIINPPVEVGKTIISSASNLFAKHIMFLAVGKERRAEIFNFEKKDPLETLDFCLSRSLDKTEEMGLKSLALPIISDNSLDTMTVAQKMIEVLYHRAQTSYFKEIQLVLEIKRDFYIFDAALEARLAQNTIFKGEKIIQPRITIIGKDDAAKIKARVIYGVITRIKSDALIVAITPDANNLCPVNLDIIRCTSGQYHSRLYEDPKMLERPIAQCFRGDQRFHAGAFNDLIFVPDIPSLSVKDMVLLGLNSAHLSEHKNVCLAPIHTENAAQHEIINIAHEMRDAIEQFRAEHPKTTLETIRIVGTDSSIIEPLKQVITT